MINLRVSQKQLYIMFDQWLGNWQAPGHCIYLYRFCHSSFQPLGQNSDQKTALPADFMPNIPGIYEWIKRSRDINSSMINSPSSIFHFHLYFDCFVVLVCAISSFVPLPFDILQQNLQGSPRHTYICEHHHVNVITVSRSWINAHNLKQRYSK